MLSISWFTAGFAVYGVVDLLPDILHRIQWSDNIAQ
jgi:hypothetical protein